MSNAVNQSHITSFFETSVGRELSDLYWFHSGLLTIPDCESTASSVENSDSEDCTERCWLCCDQMKALCQTLAEEGKDSLGLNLSEALRQDLRLSLKSNPDLNLSRDLDFPKAVARLRQIQVDLDRGLEQPCVERSSNDFRPLISQFDIGLSTFLDILSRVLKLYNITETPSLVFSQPELEHLIYDVFCLIFVAGGSLKHDTPIFESLLNQHTENHIDLKLYL